MNIIKEIISENTLYIILYIVCATLTIIILAINRTKIKIGFTDWKKDTLNLVVFKREWESNNDKFIEELFSENEKLSSENKALKRQFKNVSTFALMLLILELIRQKLKD